MRKITGEQMQRIRNGDRLALTRKLTERKVREIRQAYGRYKGNMRHYHPDGPTMAELARKFGVSESAISNVVKRRTWKHVP